VGIIAQAVIHILADAVIRPGIAFRPPPSVLSAALLVHAPPPLRIVIAKPRRDLVAGAVP
jgi:hypothetical protein